MVTPGLIVKRLSAYLRNLVSLALFSPLQSKHEKCLRTCERAHLQNLCLRLCEALLMWVLVSDLDL